MNSLKRFWVQLCDKDDDNINTNNDDDGGDDDDDDDDDDEDDDDDDDDDDDGDADDGDDDDDDDDDDDEDDDDDDDDDVDDDDGECLYHGSPAFDSRRAEHQRSSGRSCLSRRCDPGPAPASQLFLCLHITRKSYAVRAVSPKASDPR